MTGSSICLRGVSKRFGGIQAVDQLDIDLDQDVINGLVGPNGAGKTTVFNLITGVIRADAGSITLNGRELIGQRPQEVVKAGVARSFQDLRLFVRMTVLENVLVAQRWNGGTLGYLVLPAERAGLDVEAARGLLKRLGLSKFEERPASSLSYAQLKVLAIARLLATGASFLLLDEPASGLDEAAVKSMIGLLRELSQQGVGISVVEHNMGVIRELCDRVAFMADGKCIAVGRPDEVMARQDLVDLFFGVS